MTVSVTFGRRRHAAETYVLRLHPPRTICETVPGPSIVVLLCIASCAMCAQATIRSSTTPLR